MSERPSLRLVEGGVSNSRPRPETRAGRGVDTVRFRYRDDVHGYERFRRAGPYQEGPRGEVYRQQDGVRLGAYRDGALYAEGRLAAFVCGAHDHSLIPARALRAGALMAALRFGFPVNHKNAHLGRLDIATEKQFDDGQDGLAFLHALSLADVPWAKIATEGKKRDRIETVYLRSARGRTILMRAYDKGVESGIAEVGTLIRFERQRRYRKAVEPAVDDAATHDLRDAFVGRELATLLDVTAEVVCDTWGAIDRLTELASQGRLTAAKADALAGFLIRQGEGHKRSTWYGRHADLRANGILLDPLARRQTTVPVAQHLRDMISAFAV